MATDLGPLLSRLPGCAHLGEEARAALLGGSRAVAWPAGTPLFTEGEPAPDWYGIVEHGAIRISGLGPEGQVHADYLVPGDVVDPGTPGLPASYSASAQEATRAWLVPQSLVARHRGTLAVGPASTYRGDMTLFVRRVGDLIKGAPATCAPSVTVAEVAQLMTRRSIGSVIVLGDDGTIAGIVTDRDLRTRVVAPGLPPSTPVARVMSSPVLGIGPGALAFDALLEMMRRGIRHLAVTSDGRLLGVVSSHDLVLLQGAHPVGLVREIESAGSEEGLVALAPRVASVVRWLAGGGAGAAEIGRLVAELNDRLVRRALDLVLSATEAAGHGRPPVPFTWLAAGSEGRREQTLKTDQDNGLVYRDPPAGQEATAATYFEQLATRMGQALSRLGFPPCAGGFMASNPQWRQPERVWRQYFESWMETPQPEALLRASLFFDLRPVAGSDEVGATLWEWVCGRAPSRVLFLRHMAKSALERPVPLGFFGGFVVERSGGHKDLLDLKGRGIFPITQAMRTYALSLGVRETNTLDRLSAAGARGVFTPREVAEVSDAYELVARLRLAHQLACLDGGLPPDNFIDPRTLGKADRLLLKEAFKTIAWVQRHLADRFQTSVVT
jgi:CBS domain-containing protein